MQMMLPYMTSVGESLDIKFSYGGNIGNTLNSHRLIRFAGTKGRQLEVTEEIYKDYFENQQDISLVEVLASAAERAGLSKAEVTCCEFPLFLFE
jgi:predicted DsbA family dithiol-disulfide isomerase